MTLPNPTQHAADIAAAVRSRARSAVEVTTAALARLSAIEPSIDAFLDIFHDHALEQARAVDTRIADGIATGNGGSSGGLPLAGVPVAIKDNICTAFGTTTAASRFLADYRSPFSATAVRRLLDAGAIVLGKTNMDEFGMGSSTEKSAFKKTKNPWDTSRVPGGSSGGSAAAVAARIAPIALGSDTGGSIRQPASYCGVVGLKPTYGRVSRSGLIAYASSLDQIGPLAASVADAALALAVIAGRDPHDATSAHLPAADRNPSGSLEPWTTTLDRPIPNLRIAVPRQAISAANHPEVTRVFNDAITKFLSLGAIIEEIDLPMTDYAVAAYYIVAAAEASSNLARFDGVRFGRRAANSRSLDDLYRDSRAQGFGPEVQRRIMLGTHVLSGGYYDAYYNKALQARRLIKQDFDRALRTTHPDDATPAPGAHAVLMPAAPNPAFRFGEKNNDPLAMYLEDVYTVAVNLAGLPAICLPAGLARIERAELPVGIQLIAAPFAEGTLLRVARMFEANSHWSTLTPPAPAAS
jgi:aspartyl-tRNA(Asn)/glutamyl-tRNA(Gln) amidotransferase subunit A